MPTDQLLMEPPGQDSRQHASNSTASDHRVATRHDWAGEWVPAHRCVLIVAGVDIGLAAAAPIVAYRLSNITWLQVGAAVMAVITFLGVWLVQRTSGVGRADTNSMRDGIAAAFVVTYLAMVGWSAYFGFDNTEKLSTDVSKTLVSNFTVLTGVVVGGYFTTDVLKQVTRIKAVHGQGQSSGTQRAG